MKIYTTSRDDYLKALLVLQKKMGQVRSVDLANYLDVSRASVCRAVSGLEESGYILMEADHHLSFTEKGRQIAENIYERHCFFTRHLMDVGVDSVTAEEDACRLEHAISEKSFRMLKQALEQS